MERRQFISLIGRAAPWPLAVRAQQARLKRSLTVPPTLRALADEVIE